jgi:PAS domain S-box-containing protein
MERRVGFLESEFERALATRGPREESRNGPSLHAERERRFRDLLDALPAAIYTTDATGRLTYFNEPAAALCGGDPKLGSADWCPTWKLFWPDGRAMTDAETPMAVALREGRAVRGVEMRAEQPDGTQVWLLPYPTPLFDQSGGLIGTVNMLVDISERKRAADEQDMLVREVHHRVRNTLAIAQAVVGSTAKTSGTIEEFKDALIGRISALARTHLLLSDGALNSVSFGAMLHSELDPFDDASGVRVVVNGPALDIPARYAVPLGMVLHELTTNSAKYGALSALGGRVDASWEMAERDGRRCLDFEWTESGGPDVVQPTRRGFGCQLLDVVLPRQINADTKVEYRREGLQVKIAVPLPAEPKD